MTILTTGNIGLVFDQSIANDTKVLGCFTGNISDENLTLFEIIFGNNSKISLISDFSKNTVYFKNTGTNIILSCINISAMPKDDYYYLYPVNQRLFPLDPGKTFEIIYPSNAGSGDVYFKYADNVLLLPDCSFYDESTNDCVSTDLSVKCLKVLANDERILKLDAGFSYVEMLPSLS